MAGMLVLQFAGGDLPLLRRLELTALDLRMRVRGAEPPGPETAIVRIDEGDLARFGRWPLPRARYAELVAALSRAGARAIVIDLLFVEPEPDGDAALAAAMRGTGRVALPFGFSFGQSPAPPDPAIAAAAYGHVDAEGAPLASPLQPSGVLRPVAALAAAAALGHVLVAYDVDGAPRYDHLAQEYAFGYYPSLAVRAVQLYQGVPWPQVRLALGRGVGIGTRFLAADGADRLLINYLGPPGQFPTYSLAAVLDGTVPSPAFQDRIVVVEASITGLKDSFATPFSLTLPGGERLATVIDNLLHDRGLGRPAALPWLEAALLLAAAALLGLAVARLAAPLAALVLVGLALLVLLGGQVALAPFRLWAMTALPLAGLVLAYLVAAIHRHALLGREHRQVRQAFGRYLPPEMVERLASTGAVPEPGGEQRDLTVLFCDIRGFSALSERLSAPELAALINDFLGTMSRAVLDTGGTIDKYLGDGLMAFWNAPDAQPDHIARACRTALAMLQRLEALNRSLAPQHPAGALAIGIGLNTGTCTVGNFGTADRLDYSALGDAVNIAARLETETKAYGLPILIGPATAAGAGEQFATLPVDRIRMRGRAAPIDIFTLLGDGSVRASPSFAALQRSHAELHAAIAAGEWRRAAALLEAVRDAADPTLTGLHTAIAARLAQQG